MSSIFKKLSVLFCCLFGLVSLNSVVSAKPGDYLVYFLGKDKDRDSLECGKCKRSLLEQSGKFCCPNHCTLCANCNIPESAHGCKCGVGDAHLLLRTYGPFCFIHYENGGNFRNVFENAKNFGKLYCAYCMKKELNGNFNGTIIFCVPTDSEMQYFSEVQCSSGEPLNKIFKLDTLDDNAGILSNVCNNCKLSLLKELKPVITFLSNAHK